MDLFGVIFFIHDVEVRMLDSVTLFQDFFGIGGYYGPDAGIS